MKMDKFQPYKKVDLTSIDPFGESNKPSLWRRVAGYVLYVIGASLMLSIVNNLSCGSKRDLSVGERLMHNTQVEHLEGNVK